ncbi:MULTISPECIES: phospholipid-binding lipoprotein MlaA [Dickeya]|uniref:Phospholipid-binding lipoprotein MlaA n=1 Tax=Dickeya fangzhongdai TaxID=1778540 RepID=A0A2K8QNT1_9GAMM|nr:MULTISPECIES: phospholipid-binding lipoprotein MlaA [Dickeya]ATZ95179.1 phospholipid-binding lipoprotein MlaA [Dickeya fangzhongdai]AYH48879.1 phospholipid-binding lipoprotein MlaA [Dickeya fangzhongdai]KHN63232.1 ABC transporter permease [Dickeya fangzhongdai]MBO8135194.1 phospholipid-binding lipoprotein MlaA [Dickeya fangzhongdai]QOH48620.1 phospholipid-binding lipoprotein MlaA [Dickeya fangzhongdai]
MNFRLGGVVLASALLAGCASSKTSAPEQRSDPLEGFNRTMFGFNYNVLDPYVVRPAAVVWRDYMPQPARNGLTNFFVNLSEPATMVNYFAEGKPYQAMIHFNRFFLNTLLGMGGLIDVAAMANPKLAKEEPHRFGSTLGHYDVGYGPYLVLPGYGSATLREDGGGVVDTLYPPLSYLTFWMSAGKWAVEGLETRARLLDSDGLLRNSSDPYLMVRDAYFQRHDFLANDGKSAPVANPNAKAIEGSLDEIDSDK